MASERRTAHISVLLSILVSAFGPRFAFAETPGEIPKPWTYEGSMKLQEQQRQQDQQYQQYQQQPQSPQGGSRAVPGGGGGAAAEDVRRNWQRRPPLPPDRNPLLGKWNPKGAAPNGQSGGQGNDIAAALLGGMLGGACDSMFGRRVIEFRPKTLVAIERSGSESVLNHVEYRGDGNRVAVLPQDPGSIGVLVFDFKSKDRIRAEGLGCVMARAEAAPTPTATPASVNASRGQTSTDTPSGAVLALSVISSSPGSTSIAGRKLWVLKDDAQVALIKGGLQSTPDGTVLQNWIRACLSHNMPTCQQGARALQPYSVGIATTDANGHAQTPPLPVGRYWVFSDAKVDNRRMMWNEPVDLKQGANSLILDGRNSMPVD
jgi:hypothetical protein